MKYSKNFQRDYDWYLSVKDSFCFDGTDKYYNKKGVPLIQYDKNGKSAKECFYSYDSQGVIKPTNEPELLKTLLKTKGSVNLHIKMYAEDRAKGILPRIEFDKICKEFYVPKSREKAKYCSKECMFKGQEKGFIRKCSICDTEFYVKPSKQQTHIYCSIKCRRIGLSCQQYP